MLSSNSLSQLNEQGIQMNNHQTRMKILRNSFILTMVIECVTILMQVFALSYYRFYYEKEIDTWLSLIYAYSDGQYLLFSSFCKIQVQFCSDSSFIAYRTLGFIMFIGIIFFVILIIIDLIRLGVQLHQWKKQEIAINCLIRGKCLHVISILGLLVIYLYALIQIMILSFLKFSGIGISVWIGFLGVFLYIAAILFYRYIKGRLKRAKCLDKLLRDSSSFDQELAPPKKSMEIFKSLLQEEDDDEFLSLN